MKKGTLFLLFSVVLLGGGVAGSAFLHGGTESIVPAPRTQEITATTLQEETIPITFKVDGIEQQINVVLGSSAYDAMVQAKETSGLSFEGSEFPGLGFFVEEINGLRQNPRAGKYWIYYINGRKAEVGISVYKLKTHDVISWKYEDEE